jgi:ABC-type multidrug transport system fused ATPase/permease subunit
VCYLWERERLLFTGDHVLEGVSPVILPPDGDMSAYLHSLDKLQSHHFERIAPGHGGVMERGKEIVSALRAHRLAREEKVLSGLRRLHGATLDELVPVVYDDVAPERHVWARLTLEAHLIKLAREPRGERDGAGGSASHEERLAILLHAVSVRRGHKWVLRDISWRLRPGERWALLGDNGASKTSCSSLSGDVWPTPGKEPAARSRGHDGAECTGSAACRWA